MPRLPIDYTNAIVYKLCCNNIAIKDIYIGSTTNFTNRKNGHKSTCNNPNAAKHHLLVYTTIRANGGWDNWSMIIIVTKTCVDSNDLRRLERTYIESLGATLNCKKPIVSEAELDGYYAEYRLANREHISEYKAEYRLANKESIAEYTAEYHIANKESINKKHRAHHMANRDRINEKRRAKRALKKIQFLSV